MPFSQAALISFFYSLAEGGLLGSLLVQFFVNFKVGIHSSEIRSIIYLVIFYLICMVSAEAKIVKNLEVMQLNLKIQL